MPLANLHFDSSLPQLPFRPTNVQIIIILSVLSGFLLLVGAINFVNYTLAQSFSRVKEFGTRKIVGANKKHLFIQILTEVFLSTTLAFLLAVLIAYGMLPTFNSFFSLKLQLDASGHIIQFLLLLWVVLIILSGIYPAAHLSSIQAMSLFRGADTLKFGSKKVRQGLLVVQTTLSLGMIIATLVMYHQLKFIQNSADSYNHEQTFAVDMPSIDLNSDSSGWQQHEAAVKKTLKNQLLMSPNIEEVSTFMGKSFLNENYLMVGNLEWRGKSPSFQAQYGNWPVDEDFDKTLNLQLREGRWFYSGDSTDQNALILNETAVKDFQLAEPVIGTNMYNNGLDGVIIGIVKDFHFQNLREKIRPMVIYKKNNWGSSFIIKTRPNAVLPALRDVKQVMKNRFPNDILTYRFIDDEFNTLYKRDQQMLALTLSLAIISITLCVIGLWGMILFESNQRIKEIGIRKVLGATALHIMSLLSKDFIKLILLAVILASPIAWWIMHKWLENFAYKIAIQWWMFALAGLTAIAIALITVSSQVIKAAVANPVDSLRDE
nr:FtsX-like permease family protein [Olivibacter sp. SDN3]